MSPSLIEVDAFSFPPLLVPRVAKEHHHSIEEAADMVKEAKRMLYLSIVSDQSIAPSNIVDEAWHEMLMFTRFYKQFAEFIGGFIHHDPTDPEMPIEKTQVQDGSSPVAPKETPVYTRTKRNYETYFGEKPDPKYWP